MSDFITSDDIYTDYDKPTSEEVAETESADDYAGGTEYEYEPSTGEQHAKQDKQIEDAVRKEIDKERAYYANIDKVVSRVNPNYSGQVMLRTVPVFPGIATQLCQEKENRGLIRIGVGITSSSSVTATVMASIGLHQGIKFGGSDTILYASPNATLITPYLDLRTRQALWVIGHTSQEITYLSIVEEFD